MARALHAGEHWADTGLVFTTEFGGPVDPLNVLGTIEIAAAKVGVKDVGVHTLRHSAAVAWLEAGVHIKAVAYLLSFLVPFGDARACGKIGCGRSPRSITLWRR